MNDPDDAARDELRLRLLHDEVARIMGKRAASDDTTLAELGFSSLRLVDLIMACDEIYGTEVPFELLDFGMTSTVGGLHRQILLVLAQPA